ncbi:hypothetical protein B566_EDAN006717 [Ephemera danica]|nr:hypothetical protein B566_EDAN006717 [Ephemera danica]
MSSIMIDTRAGSSTTGSEDPCPGMSSGPRKRSREADSPCCLGGCGNPQCSAKKSAVEVDSSPEHSRKISWWYLKLDSETENYDSDTPDSLKYEKVVQDSDDDLSDDETRWQQQHHLELELATDHSSEEGPFRRRGNCSSSSTTGSSDLEVGPDRSLSPLDR